MLRAGLLLLSDKAPRCFLSGTRVEGEQPRRSDKLYK